MDAALDNRTASDDAPDDAYTCLGCGETFEPASDAELDALGDCYICRSRQPIRPAVVVAVPVVDASETRDDEPRPNTRELSDVSSFRSQWLKENERANELQERLDRVRAARDAVPESKTAT